MSQDVVTTLSTCMVSQQSDFRKDVHDLCNCMLAMQLSVAEVKDQLVENKHDLHAIDNIEAALAEARLLLNVLSTDDTKSV